MHISLIAAVRRWHCLLRNDRDLIAFEHNLGGQAVREGSPSLVPHGRFVPPPRAIATAPRAIATGIPINE